MALFVMRSGDEKWFSLEERFYPSTEAHILYHPPQAQTSGAEERRKSMVMDTVALVLTIVGAINWLLVGVFQFDLVAWLFGGQGAIISRILYTIIGAAGVWCITLLFKNKGNT